MMYTERAASDASAREFAFLLFYALRKSWIYSRRIANINTREFVKQIHYSLIKSKNPILPRDITAAKWEYAGAIIARESIQNK